MTKHEIHSKKPCSPSGNGAWSCPNNMTNKKHLGVERLLRAMIEELPVIYMPREPPPAGSPDAIRWGRHWHHYTIWLQFKTASGYRLFPFSSWREEKDAATAALQAGRRYPHADLRYLDQIEVRALQEGAE